MKRSLLAAGLAVLCITAFVQYQALRKLNAEGERLRALLADAHARAEAERAAGAAQPTEGERERLRAERAELVRLRGQVADLRRDLKGMEQAMARASAAAKTNRPAAGPVQSFVANVQATVPLQQTLVTGGWKLPSGNHALFFIEPVVVDEAGNVRAPSPSANSPGQVSVQTRIVELSEEALTRHGLTGLKSDAAETGGQLLLTYAQQRQILDGLEQEEGVNILAAPRVVTLSGRQAQVKVVETTMVLAGESFETGPLLDLVPTVAADGRSIDMRVSAQMRLRRQ